MNYTITEVSEMLNLSPSAIRYYERVDLLPEIGRKKNGVRFFTDSDIERLTLICCLKKTGMSIQDIQNCFFYCDQGDCMIDERLRIFMAHRQHILSEICESLKYLERVDEKIDYLNYRKKAVQEDLKPDCNLLK
jgi:MerR family transcriptional regulator, aldehyde-responsive regulator